MHLVALPGRLIPPKSRALTGRLSLRDGSVVSFESSLERDCVIGLDFAAAGRLIRTQPFTLEYGDTASNQLRYYTPDVFVQYGRYEARPTQVIEVKPLEKLQECLATERHKHLAMEEYCASRGWQFLIQTENDIRRANYIQNASFLRGYINRPYRPEQAMPMLDRLHDIGLSTPHALISDCFTTESLQAHGIWVLWCLVANGIVRTDLNLAINMASTKLWLSPDYRKAQPLELKHQHILYESTL